MDWSTCTSFLMGRILSLPTTGTLTLLLGTLPIFKLKFFHFIFKKKILKKNILKQRFGEPITRYEYHHSFYYSWLKPKDQKLRF